MPGIWKPMISSESREVGLERGEHRRKDAAELVRDCHG